MNITGMVIEILVTGLQTSIWLILFILCIFGYNKLIQPDAIGELIAGLERWSGLITIFIIGFSYTLGILFDRFWDSLFERVKYLSNLKKEIEKESLKEHNLEFIPNLSLDAFDIMRVHIFFKSDTMVRFLDYIRSRMRIARASCGNFILVTIFSVVFVLLMVKDIMLKWTLSLLIVGLSILLTLLSFCAWKEIMKNYYEQILLIYKELFGESGLKSPIKKVEERKESTMNGEGTKSSLAQDEILMREYDSVVKQIIHWDSHFWHKSQFFLAIQSVFVIGALKILIEQISIPLSLLFAVTIFNIYLCYVWFRTNRRNREYIDLRKKRALDIESDKRLQDVLLTFRSDEKNLSKSHQSAWWEIRLPYVFIVAWIGLFILAAYKFFVCSGG